jgi:hypothetical protein
MGGRVPVQFGAQSSQTEKTSQAPASKSLLRRSCAIFTKPLAWLGKPLGTAAAWMMSPFRTLKAKMGRLCWSKRLYNGYDNALGVPRIRKPIKAMAWAAATFLVGCIPPFHPLIFATPITFMTTLLVDWFVGFAEGISADPDKMRQELDLRRSLVTDPPNQPASPHD